MGLDGAPGHVELFGNFRVVTALQQQICNLLLPPAKPNRHFLHRPPPEEQWFPQATLSPARQGILRH
jgi:hypothetical protein